MQNTYMNKEDDLQAAVKEGEDRVKGVVHELENKLKKGQEQAQKAFENVDKKLHENPWPIVGGVAIGCILLGFIMGSRR